MEENVRGGAEVHEEDCWHHAQDQEGKRQLGEKKKSGALTLLCDNVLGVSNINHVIEMIIECKDVYFINF